ncbi:MAG TPA: hypothetical protein VGD81_08275 [Opitutaceae bacterium]
MAVAPVADDYGPPLPSEAEEAAMISEMRERGEPVKPVAPPDDAEAETDAKAKLPPLDSLVKQVPPDVIETLDELFRAKWVGVRKVPKAVLKEG